MTSRKKPVARYRRKRLGKTNYKKRLILLLSKKPRLVIRKTNLKIIAQIIEYNSTGDKVVVSADTSHLKKLFGWEYSLKNTPAAYLLGILVGKQALNKKISSAILDLGMQRSIKGSKMYALLKGAIDAGLSIPADQKTFPTQERIEGKHIADFSHKDSKNFSKQKGIVDGLPKKAQEIKLSILKK